MNEIERLQQLAGIVRQINEEPETGDQVVKTVVGHVDDEVDMIAKELYKIGKYSIALHRMLKQVPNGDLPQWWTGKIVKAGEYISAAKHYLDGELNAPDLDAAVSDDVKRSDPSGLS
jgi:hypothetical protein